MCDENVSFKISVTVRPKEGLVGRALACTDYTIIIICKGCRLQIYNPSFGMTATKILKAAFFAAYAYLNTVIII